MLVPTAEGGAALKAEGKFSFRQAEFEVPLWYLDRASWQAVGYLGLTLVVWAAIVDWVIATVRLEVIS